MGGVMGLKRLAARLLVAAALTLTAGEFLTSVSQDKTEKGDTDAKTLAKRCKAKIVTQSELKHKTIKVRKGEKATGFTPLVTFQITESGDVIRVHLKRSSGFRDVDKAAIEFVNSARYNARPGCPVIESEASVNIDY